MDVSGGTYPERVGDDSGREAALQSEITGKNRYNDGQERKGNRSAAGDGFSGPDSDPTGCGTVPATGSLKREDRAMNRRFDVEDRHQPVW